MERDHLEPETRSFPLIITPDDRDHSQDRLLQQTTNDPGLKERPLRFKSLHRPRTYSASSYASQPEDDTGAPVARADHPFPDDRGRNSFQPHDETTYAGGGAYVPLQGPSQLWLPFWLSKIVLICFLLLFAALLTALLLVWYANGQRNGFFVADSTSPYTWTYGPTAVLVIVISLWRMVDYHCKTLTPWAELRNGPVGASKSLRLDYLSPLQLSSLLKALGNGHLAVVATITAFILLKVLTIFSTALFVLNTVPAFDSTFQINTTTKFDPVLASAFNGTSSLDSKQISNGPLYAWYGHIAHGLPYASGASSEYVYQTFEAAGTSPANISLSTEVDAFVPFANCNEVDARIDGLSSIQGLNKTHSFSTNLSLILPDGIICDHWSIVTVPVQDPQHYVTPERQLTGTYQDVYCSTTNSGSKVDLAKGPDAYLYTITDVRYTQKLLKNATLLEKNSSVIAHANSTSRTVKKMANVLCLPNYIITRLNVTNSTMGFLNDRSGQTQITRSKDARNRTLAGFSAQNLSSVYGATTLAAPNLFGDTQESPISSAPQVPNVMFNLLGVVENSTDYSIFLNGQHLKSAAEALFTGLTLEIVQQNLMSSDSSTTTGQAVFLQNRLYIRSTSLWVMAAGFAILMLLTVLVLLIAPSAVVSRDPSSIATHAAILARSPDLNRELRREGTTQDASQRSILGPHSYRASVVASDVGPPAFKIQIQPGGRRDSIPSRNLPLVSWWSPITLSSPVLLVMIILPIGAIVALELLQRASDRDNGLLTLPENRFSEAYIHYVPALVMLLIAALFSALNFNVAVFTPFSTLRSQNAASRRTITSHLLGRTPPFAIYEALRSLQLGALLSLSAALVGSVLTIIVSGLYSVELLSSSGPTRTLTQLDIFNVTWNNSYANDNGAAAILSLIEHQNFSYPDFTYEELAFPSFAIGAFNNEPDEFALVSGPAYASVPALRANLDCKILPESAYTVSTTVDQALVAAEFELPSYCRLAGIDRNESTLQISNNFLLAPKGEFGYAGAQLDLLFGNGTRGINSGERYGLNTSDNPPGCPSLAFTFGTFKLGSTDRSNVTTMVCYQQLQQVTAAVAFLANSTDIDTASPPTVDESSVTTLANPLSATGNTAFEYRLQNNLLNEIATFNGSGYVAAEGGVSTIDIFYQAVINGSDKIKEEDLVGFDNHQRFYNATNHFYRKYMAQAINANMRTQCLASGCPSDLLSKRQTTSSDLQATVSVSKPRLVQSATSKLILQILLGVMLFCGILAYLLTPMRHILPCNPCTIAGTMALLAGSKLCWSIDEAVCECCGKPQSQTADSMIHAEGDHHEERVELIPHGAEWMSDKDLRAVFSKMRYTLGWWKRGYGDGNRGEGKRYGIDIGRADGLDDQDWELGRKRTRRYTDEEGDVRRSRHVPNWMMEPLKEEEPPRPQLAKQLSDNQIRESRLPVWMLGPLKPEKVQVQEHELAERRAKAAGEDGDLGMAQPQFQLNSTRQSRLPNWMLGPLKTPPDEAMRGASARPGEVFASGALPADTPGLGPRGS
jgi:hypothetical protein